MNNDFIIIKNIKLFIYSLDSIIVNILIEIRLLKIDYIILVIIFYI